MTSLASDTNINISQDEAGSWYYQIGEGYTEPLYSFPITIISTNPSETIPIYIFFTTDITITNPAEFFIAGSAGIDFYGLRSIITIDNVPNYPGFIQNGTQDGNGWPRVYTELIRIKVINSSTLASGGGWVCQTYFGNGTAENYISNCWSDGAIPTTSGGVVGRFVAANSGEVSITRCYSLGSIGAYSGGISGKATGAGTLIILNCYSIGDIGQYGGGILAADSDGIIFVQSSYSRGVIGESGGGIVGSNAGNFITVLNCYSVGSIGANAGGILGADISVISNASYCYTSGLGADSTSGGIYASNSNDNLGSASNNYSERNNGNIGIWVDDNAHSVMTGTPSDVSLYGGTWCHPVANTPYEFSNFGLSPYTTMISTSYNQTILQDGQSDPSLLPSGYTYSILAVIDTVTETQISFSSGLSIDSETGVITVSTNFPPGSYLVIVRNSINPYDISEFELIVDLACYGPGTRILIGEPVVQTDELLSTGRSKRKGKLPVTLIDRYADISTLRPGMLVKTWRSGYVPIIAVGVKTIRTGDNPKTALFRVPVYRNQDGELLVTGGHSILINNDIIKRIPRETRRLLKYQRPLIDGCQRVLAMNWPGAKQVPSCVIIEIYHIVLGDSSRCKGRSVNYGIWVNEGWLSESTTMKYFTRYGFKMLGQGPEPVHNTKP